MGVVTNIEELMAEFDASTEGRLENPESIQEQFINSLQINEGTLLDGYSQVFYLDRSRMTEDKVVEMKAMWFDTSGNMVDRPAEIINMIRANKKEQ